MFSAGANVSFARRKIQLENVQVPIDCGSTSVGITAGDSVVIAADKTPPSALRDMLTIRHVEKIDSHIGMVYSGYDPDYRILVTAARKMAQVYSLHHQEPIPVKELVNKMAIVMDEHTNLLSVRPYAVSLLICGWSGGSAQLYQVDHSGLYSAWKACAQGKNAEHCNNLLVERYRQIDDVEDAIHTAFHTLWQGGSEMLPDNMEIGICDPNGFHRMDQGSLQEYLYCFAT